MYIPITDIFLIYVGFTPLCHLIESFLCMVLLEAPENAQYHVMYLAFQLPFNSIIFQTTFHCQCMMKWNYDIRIHYEVTES
jgi:hypothetical protein